MRASRDKGAAGELEVRDLLIAWWSRLEPGVKFHRTPLSGGWQGAAAFKARGDLMVPPTSRFPWSVEVKRREGWAPSRFIAGHRSPVWGWWAQACRAAADTSAEHHEIVLPMLWCRRSRGHWIVLLPVAQYVTRVAPIVLARYTWTPPVLAARGVQVAPVGYWGEELIASDPRDWLP